MLIDARNGPSYDLPTAAAPTRSYVIAATPRTGSTLLCRALWASGEVGAPKEYFNPIQLRDWEVRLGSPLSRWSHACLWGPAVRYVGRWGWSRVRLEAHWQRVCERRKASNGWCGIKLHRHHRDGLFGPGSLEASLGEIRWIRVVRRDRIAQAVSWSRALQTGRFASHQRPGIPSFYSRRHIAACLDRIDRHEAAWDAELAGQPVLALVYEELAADLTKALREVLTWLEVPGAAGAKAAPPALARQADDLNANRIARFKSRGGGGEG